MIDFLPTRPVVQCIRNAALARGEEAAATREMPGYRARRWVVERTHAWMNRFRRLLIRWEKQVENYLAMVELACACISFRAAKVFG
jgi:putative transposase